MIAFWIFKGVPLSFRGVEKNSSNLVRATAYGSSPCQKPELQLQLARKKCCMFHFLVSDC